MTNKISLADARYTGISTRCLVKTNAENYMYAGFQVNNGSKTVALGAYNVNQIVGNNFLPRIEVKTFPNAELVYTDDNPNLKSSLSTTLTLQEGWYTITVSPVEQEGVAIVYVNEIDETGATLASISTRCYVGTIARDAMIAGVEVKGGEQCTEVQGLGIKEITDNNFSPNLSLQTFPDGQYFTEIKDIYRASNLENKNKVKQNKRLPQGPYTAMLTPLNSSGIGQVVVSAKAISECPIENDPTDTETFPNPSTDEKPSSFSSIPKPLSSLIFPETLVGSTSKQNISIVNEGDSNLELNNYSFTGLNSSDFKTSTASLTIPAKQSKQVTLQCKPSDKGERVASLQISTNDPNNLLVNYNLSCVGKRTTQCLPDLSSPDPNIVGRLGEGYETDRDKVKPISCLNNLLVGSNQPFYEVGTASASLDGSKIFTYNELLKEFKLQYSVDVKAELFSAKNETKFALTKKERGASYSMIFKFDVRLPNAKFPIDTNNVLNNLARSVYEEGDSCKFKTTCGDKFITQIERGANLYVAITFNFTSEKDKIEFSQVMEGSFGFEKLSGNLNRTTSSLDERLKETARMTIEGLQIGGDVTALGDILGGSNADGTLAPALTCSLNALADCDKAVQDIIDYAKGTFTETVKTAPATLDYMYSRYEDIGIFPQLESETTPKILTARTRLAQEYVQQLQDLEQVRFLSKEYISMYSTPEKQVLSNLEKDLQVNVEILRVAAGVCFGDLKNCVLKQQEAFRSLINYDKSLLEPPKPIELKNIDEVKIGDTGIGTKCDLPPNYVLTGFAAGSGGANINPLMCEGRKLNANGTLGAKEQFGDNASEVKITVPDGNYVMVGLGVEVHSWKAGASSTFGKCHNFKHHQRVNKLTIQYREFDAVTKQLIGDIYEKEVKNTRSYYGGCKAEPQGTTFKGYDAESQNFDIDTTIPTSIGFGYYMDNFRAKIGSVYVKLSLFK